jgi:Uma2 family endonuclease
MGAVVTKFDYHVERIHGQEIQKPLPKRLHAIVQTNIILALGALVSGLPLEILTELDVLTNSDGDWLVPDVVVAHTEATYQDGKLASPAELAVEIMSPGQTIAGLFSKCEMLHAAGTKHCWVIWPAKRAAWHYFAGEFPVQAKELLEANTLQVSLSSLFSNLPDTE